MRTACAAATARLVDRYTPDLDAVTTVSELFAVGERLGAESQSVGDVRLLAQVIAAAHVDPRYADVLARTLPQWYAAVDRAAARVLADQHLERLLSAADVGRLAAMTMTGILLLDGLDGVAPGTSSAAAGRVVGRVDALVARLPVRVRRRLRAPKT